jgi:parallel beta-helix repeat protein
MLVSCLFCSFSSFGKQYIVPQNAETISKAMTMVKKGDTIVVKDGIYREHIYITPGVTLLSASLFKSVIDGNGRGTVVTIGNSSTISGFEIRNGTIGIFSTSANVTISKCRIMYHQQTGIMAVGHLPKIEDNLIVFNKGSGIQGWDVQSTTYSISHNTVAKNTNHGISIGGNSSIILENNIIANNDQFGVKANNDLVRITMIANNFYQNAKFSGLLPVDNFSIDPQFKSTEKLNFTLRNDSRCIGRGSDNQDLGARLVY